MSIVLKIRSIRVQKGYSQEFMADYLNISQKAYSHLENEITKLDVDRLSKIAAIFGVSVVELLAGEENRITKETTYAQWNLALTDFNHQLKQLKEEIRLLRLERGQS